MKKIIIGFGGTERGKNRHNESYGIHRDYTAEVKRLFKSAEQYGFDGFWEYNNDWIYNSHYWQTDARKVLEEPSFGWAFKPIVIYDALSMMNNGDCLLWVDSNDVVVGDPQILFDYAKNNNGIFCHDHSPTYYPNGNWTHRDMFVGMGLNTPPYHDAPQMQVNILAFCKENFCMDFVKKWVSYAIDWDVMIGNTRQNLPGFIDHRHEQSIFSILRAYHGLNYWKGYPYMVAKEEMGINV